MDFERHDHPDRIRLRIAGALDAISAPALAKTLEALVAEAPARVELDLTELHRLDGSGVGALVTLRAGLLGSGGRLGIVGLTGQPRTLFQLLGLDRAFSVE